MPSGGLLEDEAQSDLVTGEPPLGCPTLRTDVKESIKIKALLQLQCGGSKA